MTTFNGALLQLEHIGQENLYFTNNPTVSVFSYGWTQYFNFSNQIYDIPILNSVKFGKKISVKIPKVGDFLSKLNLNLTLPKLTINSGSYASYSDALGYAIFDGPIELKIGGTLIQQIYPDVMDIEDELTNDQLGKKLMILKSDSYSSARFNAIKDVELNINLDFWFSKSIASSLPLINLNQEIILEFKLKNFDQVINYDGITPPDPVEITNGQLFGEYYYVDLQLQNFYKHQQKSHKFLITQTKFDKILYVPSNIIKFNADFKFWGPCKELFVIAKDSVSIQNNDYFNYSKPSNSEPIIKTIGLQFDNTFRFNEYSEMTYRTITTKKHSIIPNKFMYVFPFCEWPENDQPSGFLNLTYFENSNFTMTLDNDNDTFIYIYAKILNVLNIIDGYIKLEFIG